LRHMDQKTPIIPPLPAASTSPPPTLQCGRFTLPLAHPLVMGIVNITPDSFSDGGQFLDSDRASARARQLLELGADILDLGAESTRPGAAPVGEDEEWSRLAPVLTALRDLPIPLSVDTMKPAIMRRALDAGACMINDVAALQTPGALDAVRASQAAVCLMHMKGDPRTMQQSPDYDDVVGEVAGFLSSRAQVAENAGISRQRIVLDPGFGFGKRSRHNLTLLRRLQEIANLGYPVLAGLSRKSLLGTLTGRAAPGRLAASVAAAALAVRNGASIIRAHDVAETRDAILVVKALEDPDYYLN